MAGLGKKTFVAGEVLLAQDVNGYLMDQSVMVFGGTAARSSAIPTPTEGMMSYRTDDDVVEVFDGSAYVGVGGAGGLTLINTTTFSAVANVSIGSDASPLFSATYNNYKILLNATNASSSNISFRVRANTTDESGSVYEIAILNITNGALSGIVATSTELLLTVGSQATAKAAVIDLLNPLAASPTFYSGFGMNNTASNINTKVFTGVVDNSTAYNGISFLAASGNMSGSISVYGYNL